MVTTNGVAVVEFLIDMRARFADRLRHLTTGQRASGWDTVRILNELDRSIEDAFRDFAGDVIVSTADLADVFARFRGAR